MNKKREIEQMIEKATQAGCVPGLENMEMLMAELSNIQDKLPIVHIAGTNGKGSVSVLIQEIAMAAGYSVGKYSSPAVFQEEEKYQINGVCISKEEYFQVLGEIQKACEKIEKREHRFPTLFEIETAAAFLWFFWKKCDLVILETGMGGQLDATNMIKKPLCSVIVSISRDHMGFLGDSLEEIAKQKAGIIKKNCPVVTISQEPEVLEVLEQKSRKEHADFFVADTKKITEVHYHKDKLLFSYENFSKIQLSMLGGYQPQNAICAIETAKVLQKKGFGITQKHIETGLKKACLPGRFQVISKAPLVVLDGAHNEDAAKKLRETLELGFTNKKIIYIIGVLADKEYEKIIEIMIPLAEQVFTITPDNPRALQGEILCRSVQKYQKPATFCKSMKEAAEKAFSYSRDQEDAMILVFGTLSCLKQMREEVQKILQEY